MDKVFLTVVIPCYNEEANLRLGVLEKVYAYLETKKFSWEVLISDDGSTDKSREIVKKQISELKGFRLLENPHGGKPSALLYGTKNAKGDNILFADMDQSTPIRELDKLLLFVNKEKVGAVIGSRGLVRRNFPLYRKIGAIVFSTLRRSLILPEITDTQCGFKLFKAEVLKKYFPSLEIFRVSEKVTGWKVTSWDVEFLHMIKRKGYKIYEVTVVWNDEDVSKSKGGALQKYINESKEMFLQIIKVRLNELKGQY